MNERVNKTYRLNSCSTNQLIYAYLPNVAHKRSAANSLRFLQFADYDGMDLVGHKSDHLQLHEIHRPISLLAPVPI